MIPVQPKDRRLLAMQWKGKIYFDTCLPFGLRSAPKIFSAVADALQWSLEQAGVSWIAHYLDDYITMGKAGTPECQKKLHLMVAGCRELGVPINQKKCEGPATSLVFLGFLVDTVQMSVSLPEAKTQRILSTVIEWCGKKACRKRDLESLLGHLQHAATVVRPCRTFVCRLIGLM